MKNNNFCPECGLEIGKLCPKCALEIEEKKHCIPCNRLGRCTCEGEIQPIQDNCTEYFTQDWKMYLEGSHDVCPTNEQIIEHAKKNGFEIRNIYTDFDHMQGFWRFGGDISHIKYTEFGCIETQKLTQKDTEQMNGFSTLQKPDIEDLNNYW